MSKKKLLEAKVFTVQEVAALLQVHEETVKRHLRDGSWKGTKLGKSSQNAWRIPEDEVKRLLGK